MSQRVLGIGCVALCLAFVLYPTKASTDVIKRSRTEDLVEVRASNTEGFANIWVATDLLLELRDDDLLLEPMLAGRVGLASLMHLSGRTGVPKGRTLGTTELHAQVTLPGNDNLRLFGFGASGDLMLTTTETESSEPKFAPYIGFTATVDVDFIKKLPWLPLKLYANISNLGDEKLMLHFDPISLRGGLEYKGARNSYFVGGTIVIGKEVNRIDPSDTTLSGKYENVLFTAYPGLRWRIGSSMSIVARAKIMLSAMGPSSYLPSRIFGLAVRWEMPLYFKDTNAEAVRTLIFVDQQKRAIKKGKPENERGIGAEGIGLVAKPDSLGGTADGTAGRDHISEIMGKDYFKRREELRKHREQALEEMKKIEEMLE